MKYSISLALILFLLTAPVLAQTVTPIYLPMLLGGPSGSTVPQPLPQPTPIPSPVTPMPVEQQMAMRREVIRLVNDYRVANGCPAANEHEALMNGAQAWTEYMDANNYFEHSSMVDYNWYKQRGYTLASVEENVGTGQDTPQRVVDAWKASKNHNRALLSCTYASRSYVYDIGVGLGPYGRLWTLALGERLP